jgi:TorA maturation chaperone TorD
MNARELALARGRAYHLFSTLFLHGVTAQLLPLVRSIGPLGQPPADPDAAAAEHQHVFGFNVFPFQSVFLAPDAQPGGLETSGVQSAYASAGFPFDPRGESADHIGLELRFLGWLSHREAEARAAGAQGDGEPLSGLLEAQRDFLDRHLSWWLAPLTLALQRQTRPFFGALAQMTLELVAEHRADLDRRMRPRDAQERWNGRIPEPPRLMDDAQTALHQVASFLLTPLWSGLYLGRDELGELGRHCDLPRGFGSRQQTLENLLDAAARFGRLGACVQAFDGLVEHWHGRFRGLRGPELAHRSAFWLNRLESTRSLLRRLENVRPVVGETPMEP